MAYIYDNLKSQNIPSHKPGEEEYERSVATANMLYRFSRPSYVIQPECNAHVQNIVTLAKSHDIKITIKNGGHSSAGFSSANEGILLDLSKMNKVYLDIKSETVTLQGGALWGHAYKQLINGHYDGWIINGGRCPTVGVSGFVLGGGLGPFTRSVGMGCDTLKQVTLVTADGKMVTVKDSHDPKSEKGKLFWALRGAGGGNFGVVVEMKMSVQRQQNPECKVVAGRYTWFPGVKLPKDTKDTTKMEKYNTTMKKFITTMNDFYTTNWPNQMTIDSTWLCDLQQTKSDLAVRFITYYDGNKGEFNALIDKFITDKELAEHLKRRKLPEKSTRFFHETLVAQWSEETKKAFPTTRSYSVYTSFAFQNDKARIENITRIIKEEFEIFRKMFKGEQCQLQVTFLHSGGKASEPKSSDTAFPWRDCAYHAYIMLTWDDKWLEKDMRDFCKNFKAKLRKFSMKKRAVYINFPDEALKPNELKPNELKPNAHEKAYYGKNCRKLRRVKKIWDEDNFFDWSQGVRPRKSKKTTPKPEGAKSATEMKMSAPYSITTGAGSTEMEESDDDDDIASDEDLSGEETEVDEKDLTDTMAELQWENNHLPPTNDFVGMQGISYLKF